MPDRLNLLMIVGAATPPGRLATAVDAAAELAQRGGGGVGVDVLNLAETPVEICDGRPLDRHDEATQQAVARVAAADAVLIAAPVYRASYPGVLKNLLDNTPVEALQNKPVAILAMGGSPHHYLAIDSQLRPVLAWFGAMVLPTSVYLTGADFRDGQLASEAGRGEIQALLGTMLLLARSHQRAALGPPPLAARFT